MRKAKEQKTNQMGRRTFLLGLVAVLLVLLVVGGDPAGAATPASPAASGEIRIGESVSTTGAFSQEAPHYVNDVRLAEKQINQAGGINGKNLKVLIFDNQSTNPGGLNALNKGKRPVNPSSPEHDVRP